jgi:hypothetical protein
MNDYGSMVRQLMIAATPVADTGGGYIGTAMVGKANTPVKIIESQGSYTLVEYPTGTRKSVPTYKLK